MAVRRLMGVETFGDQLRRARIAAGMTQESLAEASGMSVRGISDLERGLKQRPHHETVRLLAAALQLAGDALEAFTAAAAPRIELAVEPVPRLLTPLIGRDDEVQAGAALLRPGSGVRLVTLTGPGGVGKTRLALQLAQDLETRFADGVGFVPLAGLNDPRLVLSAIANALGIGGPAHRSPREVLVRQLQDRQVLVLLDNLEHLVDAAPDLAQLLQRCPGLSILATSRAPLRLSGEHEYRLRPLALPDPSRKKDVASLATNPAVTLFVLKARFIQPSFTLTPANSEAVANICVAVDGLPLALELAAVRMKTLTADGLLVLLSRRLGVLTGGSRDQPARHQTVRATIAWSFDLLSAEDQATFRRFAVFASGASLTGATAVIAPGDPVSTLDRLTALLDASFLQRGVGPNSQPRYAMLETIREFAREQLALHGEEHQYLERHARWCRDLAGLAAEKFDREVDVTWLDLVEADHDNFRAALAWSLENPAASPVTGLQIASALWLFWYYRSYLSEGRQWLQRAVAATGQIASRDTVRALIGLGAMTGAQGDHANAVSLLDDAIAMAEAIGDAWITAFALSVRGNLSEDRGDNDDAERFFAASRRGFAEQGDLVNVGITTYHLGVVAYGRGDLSAASAHCRSAAHAGADYLDPWTTANALGYLGLVHIALGELPDAAVALREALALFLQVGSAERIVEVGRRAATLAHAHAEPALAARLFGAMWAHGDRLRAVEMLPERTDFERAREGAYRQLGPDRFDDAWKAGAHLVMEEAVSDMCALFDRVAPEAGRDAE